MPAARRVLWYLYPLLRHTRLLGCQEAKVRSASGGLSPCKPVCIEVHGCRLAFKRAGLTPDEDPWNYTEKHIKVLEQVIRRHPTQTYTPHTPHAAPDTACWTHLLFVLKPLSLVPVIRTYERRGQT